jgi:hypothetical protein
MSKPTTNETPAVKPDATPRILGKWTLPDNCVIVERTGEKFALVGPPMRRIEPTTDRVDPDWQPPTLPVLPASAFLTRRDGRLPNPHRRRQPSPARLLLTRRQVSAINCPRALPSTVDMLLT